MNLPRAPRVNSAMTRQPRIPHLPLLLAALLLASPSALARQGDEVTSAGFEEPVDEWVALDRELAGVEALQVDQGRSNIELWGYIRTSLSWLEPEDSRSVEFDQVRLNFTGRTGSYDYRLTAEFRDGTARALDAWASKRLGGGVAFTLGRFRAPFLRSGLVEARDLLFILRTRNGFFFSQRTSADDGVMFNGDHGRFHWAAASQNGFLDSDSSQRLTGSVRVNLIGERELPWEGAYRAGDLTRLTAGAAVSDDDTASDGLAWNADIYLVHRDFSFAAEVVNYQDAYSADLPLEQRGGTTPWSVTASLMLVPDRYELALRYDDYDDDMTPNDYLQNPRDLDRKDWTLGVNRYIRGHDLKWQLNYQYADYSGRDDGDSGSRLGLGLTASF